MCKLFYITHADVDCRSYFFFFKPTTVKGTGRCEQVKKKKQRKKNQICHRVCILNRIAFAQAAARCSLKLEISDRLGQKPRHALVGRFPLANIEHIC